MDAKARMTARLVGVALAMSCAACESPTLPLPPPEKPDPMTLNADGTAVTMHGGALRGAQVFFFNHDLGEGVITTASPATGVYNAVVPLGFATLQRNTIEIWQRVGIQDSSSIGVICDRGGCQSF